MSKSIFISHSIKNREVADALVDLLETGIGIPDSEVFCSSLEGLGIPSGVNFVEFIRSQVESTDIVILLLSKEYFESHFCVAELGASWVLCHRMVPLLIPPLAYGDVKAVLTGIQLLKIEDKVALNQMHSEIIEALAIEGKTFERWEVKRDSFLNTINSGKLTEKEIVECQLSGHDENCNFQLELSSERLTCCDFTVEQTELVVGDFSGVLRAVDSVSNKVALIDCGKEALRCLLPLVRKKMVITGDDSGRILLINLLNNSVKELNRCSSAVYSISASPDGKFIYTCERKGEVIEWKLSYETRTLVRLRKIHQHESVAFCVKIIDNGQKCVSSDSVGNIIISDLNGTRSKKYRVSEGAIFSFEYNSHRFYFGDSDGTLLIGDVEEGDFRSYEGHNDAIRALTVSKYGKWCCTASKDKTLRLWDTITGQTLIVASSREYFYDVKFSSCNSTLIACDGAGKVTLVDFSKCVDSVDFKEIEMLT